MGEEAEKEPNHRETRARTHTEREREKKLSGARNNDDCNVTSNKFIEIEMNDRNDDNTKEEE